MPEIPVFPHLNAGLNGLATILLLAGYGLIRRGQQVAHKRVMLSCFVVSVLFLSSYLYYHFNYPARRLPSDAVFQLGYLLLLLTHVVLAALVPVLAIVTILKGLRQKWESHRRWARWTFPIWLYVSVTGLLVYFVLYIVYGGGELR